VSVCLSVCLVGPHLVSYVRYLLTQPQVSNVPRHPPLCPGTTGHSCTRPRLTASASALLFSHFFFFKRGLAGRISRDTPGKAGLPRLFSHGHPRLGWPPVSSYRTATVRTTNGRISVVCRVSRFECNLLSASSCRR
jgi:hypothetical protein